MPKQIDVLTEYNLDELRQVKVELEMKEINEDMKHKSTTAIARDIESPTDLSVIVALHGGGLTGLLLKNEGVVANSKIDDMEELHPVIGDVKIMKRTCESRSVIYSPNSSERAPEGAQWSQESKKIFQGVEQTQMNYEDVRYIKVRSQHSTNKILEGIMIHDRKS